MHVRGVDCARICAKNCVGPQLIRQKNQQIRFGRHFYRLRMSASRNRGRTECRGPNKTATRKVRFHRRKKLNASPALQSAFARELGMIYFLPTRSALRRALRRFAALRWMIPRFAALSRAEIKLRICSAFGFASPRLRFCKERRRVRTPRFCVARLTDCRERFSADAVLAILF